MNMYEEVKLLAKIPYSYIYPDIRVDHPWASEIYEWWNEFNTTVYYYKKKHLYLYGRSNVGKSTVVNNLIRGLGDLVIFDPSHKIGYPFDLFFQTHRCIIFEEFNLNNWDVDFFF